MPNRATDPDRSGGAIDRSRDIFVRGEMVDDTYEIRRVLGAGGMGQVFEAHDHSLNRRVAVKAAWRDLDAPPLRDEACALAAFRHPSLVTVHCRGVHKGIDYIVMERIYGVSVSDLIDLRRVSKEQVSVEETLVVLTAAAEGLSVVHRAGIAHRDIKPGNIMLTPDHRVVLMDFGLVLPEFEIDSQEYIAGSPPYMAAEALSNDLEAGSGPLVDLYALGVTIYEMLTGKLPRDAPTLEELWQTHTKPVPDIRRLRPDVPGGLASLIHEMLAFAPGERPQSADEIVWRVRALDTRHSEPAAAKPVRLLIVDDNEDVTKVLEFYARRALGDLEIEVSTACDGEEALKQIRKSEPDIMLLDLHMPRMNGVELCMHMRGERLGQACKIIAVSAGAQEEDKQLLHQLGIKDFILKGPDLSDRVTEALEETSRRLSRRSKR